MLRRIFTTVLAVALACAAGLPAFANTPPGANADGGAAPVPAEPGAGSGRGAARGERLRGDFVGLVADARAGKVGTTVRQQPAQSNNLSKGAKITIAVVVAAVVITAIVVAAKANDGPGGSIRIF